MPVCQKVLLHACSTPGFIQICKVPQLKPAEVDRRVLKALCSLLHSLGICSTVCAWASFSVMPAKNILPVKHFAFPAAQVQPEAAPAAFAVKDFKLCLMSSSIDIDRKRNWLSILKSQHLMSMLCLCRDCYVCMSFPQC